MTTDGFDGPTPQVGRAQRLIREQVGCTDEEAHLLMRARARSSDLSVAYIAAAVIDGNIRFD